MFQERIRTRLSYTPPPMTAEQSPTGSVSAALVVLRGAIGGILMGLANLVPGISGGTMLLSAGVYPEFIGAIAEVTTLRFKPRSLALLFTVGGMAALAILLFAGAVKDLVIGHRFVMYSLFIGLTLGGVPIVWRLARPVTTGLVTGGVGGFVVMLALALAQPGSSEATGPAYGLLFLSGLAGASAMILPGVSGGYLLLLLGQYVPILSAVSDFKDALLGSPRDFELAWSAMQTGIPVGLGVVAGVVGVSNLLRWLLDHYRKPTLGVLLGLLLGAVIGLWPFQQPVPPEPGQTIKGVAVTETNAATFDTEDWPLTRFSPSASQLATCAGLIAAGFAATQLLARMGRKSSDL